MWDRESLRSLRVSSPSSVPPSCFVPRAAWEAGGPWHEHCSATTQTLCYQHCSHPESKALHHTSTMLHPSQNQDAQGISKTSSGHFFILEGLWKFNRHRNADLPDSRRIREMVFSVSCKIVSLNLIMVCFDCCIKQMNFVCTSFTLLRNPYASQSFRQQSNAMDAQQQEGFANSLI